MVVESHMSCKEHSGFPKVTTVQVMDGLGELFPPYPRKVGRRRVSPFCPEFMFRPFSYCHMSQVTLGIGSLSKVASVLLAPLLARESAF